MSDTNIVTIAIASFNNGPYLERCMDSVINQTYRNIEILIVDDGSQDNTKEIIKKYKDDKRVRIILKENGGLSSVRQRALDEAVGDYICFIDADDYLLPTFVEKMLNKLRCDGTDICVCGTRFEDAEGNELINYSKSYSCPTSLKPVVTTWQALNAPRKNGVGKLLLSDSWNKMYRLSVLKKAGVKFHMPKGLNGSDSDFNLILALHALHYSTIKDLGYVHVMYNSSAVHRKNKDIDATFRFIVLDMINESEKMGMLDKHKTCISSLWYNAQDVIFDDIYYSSEKSISIGEWYKIRKRQNTFAKKSNLYSCELKMAGTRKQSVFLFIFKYFLFILPLYFKMKALKCFL